MTAEHDPFEHTRMSLGEHLDELRKRLIRGLLAVGVAFVVAFSFHQEIAQFTWQPYFRAIDRINADVLVDHQELVREDASLAREYFEDEVLSDPEFEPTSETVLVRLKQTFLLEKKLFSIKPSENFVYILKISFYAALVVGAPVLLWQLWQFVAAGLYRHEKRTVLGYFPLSLVLLFSGVSFGYLVMVPYGLYFLGKVFPPEVVQNQWTVEYLASITFALILMLGLVFQLPVLMLFFCRLGLVQPAAFAKYRRHAILAAFIASALLTPPDPYTQCMMAGPIILLYELGILLGRWGARPREVPGGDLEPSP